MDKGNNRGHLSLVLVCFFVVLINILPIPAHAVEVKNIDMSDKFEYLIEPFDVEASDVRELKSAGALRWKKYKGITDLSGKLGEKPTVWFRAKLPDSITRDTGIYFDELYAQSLDIYIGDDLVYTKSREYIQHYNSLILPLVSDDNSGYIYLKLMSSAAKAGPSSQVLISSYNALQKNYISKGLFNIYFGLALEITGLAILFISIISSKHEKTLGFSLSIILLSLGFIILSFRTNFTMFFQSFEKEIFLIYDIALFLLFPSLTYFFKSIVTENEYNFLRKFFKFQLLYSILCILISIINPIFKYKYNYIYSILTIPVVGFLFIIQLIFLISIGLKKIKSKNTNAKIFMLGFGLFSFGIIIDLVLYFLVNINQSFQIWRFGLILFVITLLVLFAKTYAEHKDRADSYELELKDISEKARLDYLTKLPNRLAIYEIFEKISAQLESESLPLSIAIIDIDDFKHINDTYGHVAGDFILVELAKLTREILGPKGELGRWGGEEFLIIFPAMNQSIAHHTSDNLRKQISNHKFEYQNHIINVTLSFGISTFVKGSTLIECVDSADQALYIAKSSGKNCVVSSSKAL
jgi:diguanylate cyclase (GGDEF)-like protein